MPDVSKEPPPYGIASVDNALRIAAMLQMEGTVQVSQVAQRLGVARSTAHRLLTMLVYRDFAVQDGNRAYRVGPVLQLADSESHGAQLRNVALPSLQRLVDVVGESANLIVRTGATARFMASVETCQATRVSSREGMVFPAHRVSGGLVLLCNVPDDRLEALYAVDRHGDQFDRPDMAKLRRDLARVRRNGFAVNRGLSERGVVAVGLPVRGHTGGPVAGVAIAMPSARYDPQRLPVIVAALRDAADAIQAQLNGDA